AGGAPRSSSPAVPQPATRPTTPTRPSARAADMPQVSGGSGPRQGSVDRGRAGANNAAMPTRTRRIVLARRPEGPLDDSVFRIEEVELPDPADGQVLVRVLWLSIDPYMRGRVSAARSYASPVEVGATMIGGAVGEVVASRHADSSVGAKVA